MKEPLSELNDKENEYVCFKLGSQDYAISIMSIIEVVPMVEITKVVHTPEFIRGVINLRGEIIVIVDVKVLFELGRTETTQKTKIVIVREDDKNAGLLVDEVSHICRCDNIDSESIPVTVTGKASEFLSGVGTEGKKPLMIINLNNIFNSEEFRQFE